MRSNADMKGSCLVRCVVWMYVFDFKGVVTVFQVGIGNFFFSCGIDPFLLVGIQSVGVCFPFVRIGKVTEGKGEVSVLIVETDI